MKKLITIFLLLITTITVSATNRYFSSSLGNDVTGTGTIGAPYATIAKLNTLTLTSGDSVLFKSGDTFIGTITPQTSGITYSSYNSGAKPIISGLSTLSSWTSLGGNIWEATVTGSPATVNTVLVNNTLTPMGRWPNSDSARGGYRTYSSFVANTSITDSLPLFGTWTGGEVVIRESDFAINRFPITSISGNTINYTGTGTGINNYGYFIQNSLATLDKQNEWFYNTTTHKLDIYSTTSPTNVQVATQANCVNMIYTSGTIHTGISFSNLSFQGSEDVLMASTYNNNLTVNNCDFNYGLDALNTRYGTPLSFTNNTVKYINNIGIHEYSNFTLSHDLTIKNNSFIGIGMYQGMLSGNTFYSNTQRGTAIVVGSGNLLIQENKLDSIGYSGINITDANNQQIIRKNTISNFCNIKNDGGGIYYSYPTTAIAHTNTISDSNIVFLSGDARAGTSHLENYHARGLYIDQNNYGIQLLNNTIFSCWDGIYLSQSQSCVIRGNTIFDCGFIQIGPPDVVAASISIADAGSPITHTKKNVITNNIFFAKYTAQGLLYGYDTFYALDSIGRIDSNYYVNTGSNARMFTYNPTFPNTYYTLASWKTAYSVVGYDVHSIANTITTPTLTSANWNTYLDFQYNNTNSATVYNFPGLIKVDGKGVSYSNSITIQPYSSVALINNGSTSTKVHYVSSVSGNDLNNGLSSLTPWQTITKVNSFTYAANDSILFKVGEIFNGKITVNRSNLYYGVYGAGASPIISGFTTATGFTNISGSIWESSALGNTNKPNMVTFSNIPTAMGRYPNTGWNRYHTFDNSTFIKDITLNGMNFTGGRINIRKLHDIISNDSITSHTDSTINYISTSGYSTLAGYGYIIENHLSTLDVQNEWFFNNTTKKIDIFSSTSPTNIKVSTIDTLMYIGANDFITVDGITFDGANVAAISMGGPSVGQSTNNIVRNCTITNSGRAAIYATFDKDCQFINNTINYAHSVGIYCENEGGQSINATITGNTIKNVGLTYGMGYIQASPSAWGGVGNAITVFGPNAAINNNVIDSIGHTGVFFYYDSIKVRNNSISNYAMKLGDCGAINTFNLNFNAPFQYGREVVGNIISNGGRGEGIGTADGLDVVVGIYVDDKGHNVRIDSNSITNTPKIALYCHNCDSVTYRGNTIYNADNAAFSVVHDNHAYGQPIRGLSFVKNIVYQSPTAYTTPKKEFYYIDMWNHIDGGNLDSGFVKLDSNKYIGHISSTDTTFHNYQFITTFTHNYKTFTGWKVLHATPPLSTAWDANSTEINAAALYYSNPSNTPLLISFPGLSKKDAYNNIYNNSTYIPTFSSLVLLDNGILTTIRKLIIKRH